VWDIIQCASFVLRDIPGTTCVLFGASLHKFKSKFLIAVGIAAIILEQSVNFFFQIKLALNRREFLTLSWFFICLVMPKLLILHADKVRKWSLQDKLKDGESLMNCRGQT
jgi:hypothetical protein